MLGNRLPVNGGGKSDDFVYVDGAGCPRLVSGLPQFVTVKGGAYFFLPVRNTRSFWLRNQQGAR
jgi:hypothetical protein